MFPVFADVPAYPLVFVVFWGAAAIFALAMARHLRVFAAARPASRSRDRSATSGAGSAASIQYALVQTRMFKDPRAGLMHAGIFWGFVLLTIGTANIVTGGVIETVLSAPFDGLLWTAISAMQNVVAVIVIASILWAFERRLISRPQRLTFNRDALLILGMIGGVVATELLAEVFEFAAHGDQPGAFVVGRPGRAASRPRPGGGPRRRCSSSCGGRTSPSSRRSSCTCRSASTSTSRPRSRTSGIASSRRGASCRRWTSSARTRRSG